MLLNIFKSNQSENIGDFELVKRQLDAVQVISHALINRTDLDSILNTIVNELGKKLRYVYPVIYLINSKDKATFRVKKVNVSEMIISAVEKVVGKSIYDVDFSIQDNNLLSEVIKNKKTLIANNFYDIYKPYLTKNVATLAQKSLSIKNIIITPIIVEEKSIGCLTVGSNQETVPESELELITTFSDQIGIAIYNTQQNEALKVQLYDLELRNKSLESLYNLTSKISSTLDPNKVVQTAVDSIPTDENLITVCAVEYSSDRKQVSLKAISLNELTKRATEITGGFSDYTINIDDYSEKDNLIVKALKTGQAQISDELESIVSSKLPKGLISALKRLANVSLIAVHPIHSQSQPIGALIYIYKNKTKESLDTSQRQLMETYAFQIGNALENATLYAESQKTQANLKEARRRERDMVDVMGHELRTPISIVRNALLSLKKDFDEDHVVAEEKLGKYLEMAVESTKREIRLIETLLSATKMEGATLQLEFTKVDMKDVVNDAIESQKALIEDKQLELRYIEPTEDFFAFTDRTRVQEIMDNLLSNAAKYTAAGHIEIIIGKNEEYITIQIKDTGIGIKEEDLANLGKKFFRTKQLFEENPGGVQPSGTGLGLYVTFSLIELLNGKKVIHSKLNEGSNFSFSLPLYNGQQDRVEQKSLKQRQTKA